ncbi:unnamed protein product (macronuclear) [Paramecium tetraurelia]|uniref:ABC transporter family protein n=2 Tax=Paramecium tetraurelia TaxID=5888 RepID=A0CET6_PARTE|nr:uncharacterized protein GSPATT00037742001 [Paramecium tetraurelia]CAK69303.1 unnamed protein product [Paramecium tetraurelia]|eukprot:XP_001436700.1 hypothetical protein (macronuclear) [Paramecium tetraurelia strain d4-2]
MNFKYINERGQQMSRQKRNQVSNFDNPEQSTLKSLRLQTDFNENQEVEPFPIQEILSESSHESIDLPEKDNHKFYPTFLGQNHSSISRLFFLQYTTYALHLKHEVLDKNYKITDKHLPALSPEDDLKQLIKNSQNQILEFDQITCKTLVKLIFFGELKWMTGKCIFAYLIESISKNGISFIMSYIIASVSQNDAQNAHMYGIILVALNFICLLSRHHAANYSMIFSTKARLNLINLVYIKLIGLNSYSFRQANIGKILNLISGDINTLEQMFSMIFPSSVVIISMIFACLILWLRFDGIIGLLAIVLLFITYPIQVLISTFNQETLKLAKLNQDKRLTITNELVEGIRLIKMQAWERAFQKIIMTIRQREFICLLKILLRTVFDRLLTQTSHLWSSLLYFIILYYGGFRTEMQVAEMISTVQLLNSLKISCVYIVSNGIQALIQIKVTFERIANVLNLQNYVMLKLEDSQNEYITNIDSEQRKIELNNFYAYWTHSVSEVDKPILKNLTLNFKEGELWAIIGRVGCGKSTLLHSLLCEIPSYKGQLLIDGQDPTLNQLKIAYVEQEPYLFPDSIKNNILFGKPYNNALYTKVTQAAQLEADFEIMKFRDYTEIGERGVTLSGGQKARISLARALYQTADLYLFDDPLSAVDASVAENIFMTAIKGFIFDYQIAQNPKKQKPIVILATHQIQYAIKCDKIAILSHGELISQGAYDQIKPNLEMINSELATQLDKTKLVNTKIDIKQENKLIKKRKKVYLKEIRNLIVQESDNQQIIDFSVYLRYFKNWNCLAFFMVVLLEVAHEVLTMLYQRVISLFEYYQDMGQIDQTYILLSSLIIGLMVCCFIKYLLNVIQVQRTTQNIHKKMLNSITLAPICYFDVNPSGRIINRFSNDLSLCDNQTNIVCLDVLELIGNFFIALITLAILQPYFIFMICFIIVLNLYQYHFYNKIVSQLKENELIQRSPLFDFIKKTLGGSIQIRVYEQQDLFKKQFLDLSNKCNLNSLTYFYSIRSFCFNIDFIGFIASSIGLFIFLNLNSNDVAVFSQGLLLLITYNDGLSLGLKQLINFATQMSSYNRMFQIVDVDSEAAQVKDIDSKLPNFPESGDIKFENVYMKYRTNSDLILKGLSFQIKSGEKVGCVGRTGAGKSSILQAIFRMSEIEDYEDSKIEIAGVDTKQLGLQKLRSSIGIIPQSPFLFTGSLRSNLDPFDQYEDQAIWKALEVAGLLGYAKSFSKGLLTDISDVNSLFSTGQKQLICLARILLQKKKIIVLDEATANLDMKTDDFIQNTLKQQLKECTLITIAHRLNTIADYDKVMVIENGNVIEFDQPFNLLAQSLNSTIIDKQSQFSKLVLNTGESNAQAIFDIAKKKSIQTCK